MLKLFKTIAPEAAAAPRSVTSITAGLQSMVDDLRDYTAEQLGVALSADEQIEALQTQAKAAEAEANRATSVASKIAALIAG